ncbi:hypothetical protein K501DRAFT_290249 [Backusella circina FSU 941]|nr:hypothetical protein K501DRAFT_290249 [Backusella circina FSU 941]
MSRILTLLYCTRLASLVMAVTIVIGSLCLYSSHSIPLGVDYASDDEQEGGKMWIIQSITDRRLISTLVAAQASIFCPLFVLLSPTGPFAAVQTEAGAASPFVEMICQFLMPLGLALSWAFSIVFDTKTTDLVRDDGMLCLQQDDAAGCALFGLIHGLKYAIIAVFAIETTLVSFAYLKRSQQAPIELFSDDIEKSAL